MPTMRATTTRADAGRARPRRLGQRRVVDRREGQADAQARRGQDHRGRRAVERAVPHVVMTTRPSVASADRPPRRGRHRAGAGPTRRAAPHRHRQEEAHEHEGRHRLESVRVRRGRAAARRRPRRPGRRRRGGDDERASRPSRPRTRPRATSGDGGPAVVHERSDREQGGHGQQGEAERADHLALGLRRREGEHDAAQGAVRASSAPSRSARRSRAHQRGAAPTTRARTRITADADRSGSPAATSRRRRARTAPPATRS